MRTAKEILFSKQNYCSDELNIMVKFNDAVEAIEEYSDQQTAELKAELEEANQEIENLKYHIQDLDSFDGI